MVIDDGWSIMSEKIELGEDTLYLENGLLHNEEGPAWVHGDGSVEYFVKGKLHRSDGPARIHANGDKEFWFDGQYQGKEINGVFYPWKVK